MTSFPPPPEGPRSSNEGDARPPTEPLDPPTSDHLSEPVAGPAWPLPPTVEAPPAPPPPPPPPPRPEPNPTEAYAPWTNPAPPDPQPTTPFAPPPPVNQPPPEEPQPPLREPQPPATPRWVKPFAILAALALFVGGALTGWAISERNHTGDSSGSTGQNQPITAPVSNPGPGPVTDDENEPVAAVAQAVAPSVVQIETNTGLGSGVIFDDDGHILTAAHVLDGADRIRVRLADGTLVAAEIVGTNAATDVGVVSIEPRDDLKPASLGVDVAINVGQMAVAVGSPFGLEQTVTSGIVSAIDRPVQTEGTALVGMIQTDASINPGNSGGALADRQGRIIGINDAIRTAGGGNEGVGFAIPIDLATRVAKQIIAGEEIQAGLLGVTVGVTTDGPPGALVKEIMPNTPAATSGIEVGDLITAVDGERITQMAGLRARILARQPGTTVTLDVLRGDQELQIEVTLASATD